MGHSRTLRDRRGLKVCSNASQPCLDKKRSPERSGPDVILNDTLNTVFERQNALQSVLDKLCFIYSLVPVFFPFTDHLHYSKTMHGAATGPMFQTDVTCEVGQGKSEWTGKIVPWSEEGQSSGDYLHASTEQYCT